MVIRLFALVVIIFVAIYQLDKFMNSDKYKYLDEYAKVSAKLQSGDIIFRKKDDDVLDKSFSVDNLGYSQVGIVVTSGENPIRELKKQRNMLQILPLKDEMFKKRFSFKFLYTNIGFLFFSPNGSNISNSSIVFLFMFFELIMPSIFITGTIC